MAESPELIYLCERFSLLMTYTSHLPRYEIIEAVQAPLTEAEEFCRKLAGLSHRNILKVRCSYPCQGAAGTEIRTEYLYSATNLWKFVQTPREFSEREIDGFVGQLLDVLAYMEMNGVHHSNIRPEFLFVNDHNELKVGFFLSDLSQGVTDYQADTDVLRLTRYDVEATAAGVVVLFLVLRRPVNEVMMSREDDLQRLCGSLQVSKKVKQLLSILLWPEKYVFKFATLKAQFEKGEITKPRPSQILQCGKCANLSSIVLPCGHQSCRDCIRPANTCPLCPAAGPQQVANITEQIARFYLSLQSPRYDTERLRINPPTISDRRYTIALLGQAYSQLVPLVSVLKHRYTSWRRANYDPNGFYRCLGVAWMEKMFRSNCPEAVRIRRVKRVLGDAKDLWQTLVAGELMQMTSKAEASRRMEALQTLFSSPEFDGALCSVIRTAIHKAAQASSADPSMMSALLTPSVPFSPTTSLDTFVTWIEQALKLEVTVYQKDSGSLKGTKTKKCRDVALVYDDNAYWLLYSVTQDMLDGYSFVNNKYAPKKPEELKIDCRYA